MARPVPVRLYVAPRPGTRPSARGIGNNLLLRGQQGWDLRAGRLTAVRGAGGLAPRSGARMPGPEWGRAAWTRGARPWGAAWAASIQEGLRLSHLWGW